MVPATVERRHEGKPASFTWWVDDVLMDEQERYRQKKDVPNTDDWNQQMWVTRLFDQLIANMDRNLGNLLIDKSYNIWMIDHSRAFRTNKDLKSPGNLSKVDRAPLERRDRRPAQPPRSHRRPLRAGRRWLALRSTSPPIALTGPLSVSLIGPAALAPARHAQ